MMILVGLDVDGLHEEQRWQCSDAGDSYWDVVLFFTLRRPKNYAWSLEVLNRSGVLLRGPFTVVSVFLLHVLS
ncbi:hypothetical protein L3X38_036513 [Prunus dulcis]|uniref:Uncharacterized protein n=1 Tax=Prunus dulcis TaxID=3755 RepID=A0AAD4YPI7_PRUDU|nr:hypothetical protein L3X38_036513 [Prunus dulcis]